jgi:hypothetical protein
MLTNYPMLQLLSRVVGAKTCSFGYGCLLSVARSRAVENFSQPLATQTRSAASQNGGR